MQLRSREPIQHNGAMKLNHRLSDRTIRMVLRILRNELFGLSRFDNPREYDFYTTHPETYTIKSEVISFQNQRRISRYLAKLGLGLNLDISRNQVLLFPRVGNHNDKGEGMPGGSVFIPIILSGGTDATFKHAAHPEEDFSVGVGDIMLFDQNIDHSLSTNMGPVGHSMSYGLALYIDKLPAKEKEAQ